MGLIQNPGKSEGFFSNFTGHQISSSDVFVTFLTVKSFNFTKVLVESEWKAGANTAEQFLRHQPSVLGHGSTGRERTTTQTPTHILHLTLYSLGHQIVQYRKKYMQHMCISVIISKQLYTNISVKTTSIRQLSQQRHFLSLNSEKIFLIKGVIE